jgi:hypothetical protein
MLPEPLARIAEKAVTNGVTARTIRPPGKSGVSAGVAGPLSRRKKASAVVGLITTKLSPDAGRVPFAEAVLADIVNVPTG